MHKRSSKGKQGPEDVNEIAYRVISEAIDETPPVEQHEKNPAAVAMGRLGGKVGGKVRAERLSPEKRTEIARKAAEARWRVDRGK